MEVLKEVSPFCAHSLDINLLFEKDLPEPDTPAFLEMQELLREVLEYTVHDAISFFLTLQYYTVSL